MIKIADIEGPFRFDGHGVNDANGRRICKVTCLEPYANNQRQEDFDKLSILLAAAPELAETLDGLHKALSRMIEKHDPDSIEAEWLQHSHEILLKAGLHT